MKDRKSDTYLREHVLASWTVLNRSVLALSIPDLERALELEIKGAQRPGVLSRLLARICRLERAIKFEQLKERLRKAA